MSEDIAMNVTGTIPSSQRVCNVIGFTSLDSSEFIDMPMKLTGS